MLLSIFIILEANAQNDIKQYVKNNTILIHSINPDSTNYSDLENIGDAIGNSKVVMLGEATHGDALTFQAKTRLVKYLHEQKGFNVLAFESDFYALNRSWDLMNQKIIPFDSLYYINNMFYIWTKCEACTTLLYEYLPSTLNSPNPIIVTGFDNQVFGEFSQNNFRNEMDSFLKSQQIPIVLTWDYNHVFLPLLDSFLLSNSYDSIPYVSLRSITERIDNELKEKTRLNDFWNLCFQSLKYEIMSDYGKIQNESWKTSYSYRDSQMSKNLSWIINSKYPDEKIIVWAANGHVNKQNEWWYSMGNYYKRDTALANSTYIIGFTSKEGFYGNVWVENGSTKEISKPRRNSFENWIPNDLDYAFVDFRGFNELKPNTHRRFYMKCESHYNFCWDWTHCFDGIFYIKEMEPCTEKE